MKGAAKTKLERDCKTFINAVSRSFERENRKYRNFTDLVLKYRHGSLKALELQMKLVELFKDNSDLIDQLNDLVPKEFNVPVQDAESKIQELLEPCMTKLKNRPEDLESFIRILREVKERRNLKSEDLAKLDLVLNDEPEMLDAIKQYLITYQKKDSAAAHFETTQFKEHYQRKEMGEYTTASAAFRARMTRGKDNFGKMPLGNGEEKPLLAYQPILGGSVSLPTVIKNEYLLFKVLEENFTKEQYEEFVKFIALFMDMVISPAELFDLTHGLFEDERYFGFFQEIINSRELARRKQTTLFKPSTDYDFSGFVRNSSYAKIGEYYPLGKAVKSKNDIINEEINHAWLSVPHGSEQNSFQLIRKNTYEETLFKCEEERYEFDNKIQMLTFGVAWLEQMTKPDTPEDKIQSLLERIIKLKIIQKLYDNNPEVIELLRTNPQGSGKIVLERLKAKLQEVKSVKSSHKPIWNDIAEKNFHRSLDHRSFSVKLCEKKLTNAKHFVKDARLRYKNLQKPIPDTDVSNYWQLLNTFEGISSDSVCKHTALNSEVFEKAQKKQVSMRKNCPIYRMAFQNQEIRDDTMKILWFAVLTFHSNHSEKEKIKKVFKSLMIDIMGFDDPCEAALYNNVISEEKILSIVSKIEAKIYDKSFSFLKQHSQDSTENQAQNTIHEMIQEFAVNKDGGEKLRGSATNEIKSNSAANGGKGQDSAKDKKKDDEDEEDELFVEQKSHSEFMSIDSAAEQEEAKAMEYLESKDNTIFLPAKQASSKLFYGNEHFLSAFRMFFTLYERMLRAWETANTFEVNSKTEKLSKEEKATLSTERYDTFRWVLVHLIRQDIENVKYEDFIRGLFGKEAYALVYLDKIIGSTIKALRNLANDDLSNKFLDLYLQSIGKQEAPDASKEKKDMEIEDRLPPVNWHEELYISKINQLAFQNLKKIADSDFFRFLIDEVININLYEVPYRGWHEEDIVLTSKYLQKYAAQTPQAHYQSSSKVLLQRNINKVKKRAEKEPTQNVIRIYNIEYKTPINSTKLITDSYFQEDLVLRTSKQAKTSFEERFEREYRRDNQFKVT